jgi:signal peptidase I
MLVLDDMKKYKYFIAVAGIIIGLVLLVLICRVFWLQPFRVDARSMEPTLLKGDVVFINRLAYSCGRPNRGDVVFLDTAELASKTTRRDKWWIKRVIGIPGDRVGIRPPYIYINGKPLKDPPVFTAISSLQQGYAGYGLADKTQFPNAPLKTDADEITLSSDEYFLIGDNTVISLDCRHFGPIKTSSIIGKVTYILAPANRRGPIE